MCLNPMPKFYGPGDPIPPPEPSHRTYAYRLDYNYNPSSFIGVLGNLDTPPVLRTLTCLTN